MKYSVNNEIITQMHNQHTFWTAIDELINNSEIIIDRPGGTSHPRYSDMIYPLDYGYLEGTTSMDGNGIDIWKGSLKSPAASAVICIVDLLKRDSEIKILIGCTPAEQEIIFQFHNNSSNMKGLLITREL